MSDVVTLRKLSRKSLLKFGKHSDLTVQQLIDTRNSIYLRWVYFNCSNITFMEDILEEIRIPFDFRINKPGKNKNLGVELSEIIKLNYSPIFKIIVEKKKEKHMNIKRAKENLTEGKFFSKNNLRLRNHGK